MKLLKSLLILALAMVLFSCDDDHNNVYLGQWTVSSVLAPDRNYQAIDSLALGIEFVDLSNANISSVCNGGKASYNADANRNLSFISVETTERACASQELNLLEADFINVLYLAERWSIVNGILSLSNADGQEILLKRK